VDLFLKSHFFPTVDEVAVSETRSQNYMHISLFFLSVESIEGDETAYNSTSYIFPSISNLLSQVLQVTQIGHCLTSGHHLLEGASLSVVIPEEVAYILEATNYDPTNS
jgi:hypothetical protein